MIKACSYPKIAIMGVIGAGKSTFINLAAGNNNLAVGHDVTSSTQDIQVQWAWVDSAWVRLIDTPGWDDTYCSDADILNLIADHLNNTYSAHQLLAGVILLQPVGGTRVSGSERRRTRLFTKILGENAYANVVIATIMWSDVSDEARAEEHAQQRVASPELWGSMVEGGARVENHENIQESAHGIIRMVLNRQAVVLHIQNELMENGGQVGKTAVGRQLTRDHLEQNAYYQGQIHDLEREMRQAKADRQALQEEVNDLRGLIAQKNLKITKTKNKKICTIF